jgi:hypothetical protein
VKIPSEFTHHVNLGSALSYYPVTILKRWGNLAFCICFLVGSALSLLYGLYDTWLAVQKNGPALIDDRLPLPLGLSILFFILGAVAGWSAFTNWNKAAVVYERGFAWRDHKGVRAWRWEEVQAITAAITRHYGIDIYTGISHIYTVFNRQNQRVVLTDALINVARLGDEIEQNTYPTLYDRASSLFNAGQELPFGPVVISKAGIIVGRRSSPWSEVREIAIRKGLLRVSKTESGWFNGAVAPTSKIPNLRVLLNILQQMAGVKVG